MPKYGEVVFSHTTGKDEFVIGDGILPIPELPRLKLNLLSDMKFAASKNERGGATEIEVVNTAAAGSYYPTFSSGKTEHEKPKATDRFKLTLASTTDTLSIGDNSHKGRLNLHDGSSNTVTVVPPSVNNDITLTLPIPTSGTTATIAAVGGDIGSATATTPTAGDNSTKVATTNFVNGSITTALSNFTDELKSKPVSTIATTTPSSTTPKSTGSLYVDDSTGILYYYNGSTWKPVKAVWG